MTGARWGDLAFVLVLAVTTGYCVTHLVRERRMRDLRAVETAMGVVMIAMLLGATFGTGTRTVTIAAFAVATPWCAARALRRPVGAAGSSVTLGGAPISQQSALCVAMVVMLAAGPTSMTAMDMSVRSSMLASATGSAPFVQILVALVVVGLLAGLGRDGHRLVRTRTAAVAGSRWPVLCRFVMVAASVWMLVPLAA